MRRRYIVDGEFQGKFILAFVLVCLSGMALSLIFFNYMAVRELESLKWRMVVYESTLGGVLTPYLVYLSAFAVLYTAAALSIVSWFLTWKVAGPIYRLRADMDRIGEGNLHLSVRLRRNDAFKGTAKELDSMVVALRERFGRIDGNYRAAKKVLDSIRDSRENLLAVKAEQLVQEVQELNDSLRD